MPGELPQPLPAPVVTLGTVLRHAEYVADNGSDPYERKLYQRVLEHVVDDPVGHKEPIITNFENSLAEHPNYTAADHIRGFSRAVGALQIWLKKSDFLERIDEPRDWDRPLSDALEDFMGQRMFAIFIGMNVLANVAERAKLIKAESLLDGIDRPVSVVELGCAQMHIRHQLDHHLTRGPLAFTPTEIVTPLTLPDGRTRYVLRKEDSQQLSVMLRRLRFGLSAYSGLDELNPRESLVSAKTEADSLYFVERARDPRRLKAYRILANLSKLRTPDFYHADCAEPLDTEHFFSTQPQLRGGADFTFLSFSYYEIPLERRKTFLENAFKVTNPRTGRIIILDHVSITRDGQISMSDQKGAYQATMTVFDNARPDRGWQHRATFENGRVRRWITEPDFANLAVARRLGLVPSRLQAT